MGKGLLELEKARRQGLVKRFFPALPLSYTAVRLRAGDGETGIEPVTWDACSSTGIRRMDLSGSW
jgi:hypothetical protein